MWSGTTLTNFSGNIFGVHQKIDRVAYRVLTDTANVKNFPSRKLILHFEGKNGPDGIKSKSPARNEPWHYIDPFDPGDTQLLDMIIEHYDQLVAELRAQNLERAAFEASWLSHAIVDGLTPAHHFPYEEKLIEMRKGQGIETRTSLKEKLIMKGETPSEKLKNNWLMWGFKGVIVSHGAFEFGVAAISAPYSFKKVQLKKDAIATARQFGMSEYFLQRLRHIALWDMYEDFSKYGWTWNLSRRVRLELMPTIIDVVAMAWYIALLEAGMTSKKRSK